MTDRTIQGLCLFSFLFFAIGVSFVRYGNDIDKDTETAIIQERINCDSTTINEKWLLSPKVITSVKPVWIYDSRVNSVLTIGKVELQLKKFRVDKELVERVILCRAAMGYLDNEGIKNNNDPYVLPDGLVDVEIVEKEGRLVIRLSAENRGIEVMWRSERFMKGKEK